MSIIEISDITKDYGEHRGVFNVSFDVQEGETLGFLGPNGAGKTTTIRQLMGFIKPDKGSVIINGMDCFKEVEKIQKDLGYLPGEIAFMDDMTGMEFIKFIAGMKNIKDMTYAHELIQYFELNANGKIKKMSKGMKQKIGLVCAFMQNPSILVLDEPTSGLDPLMQNKFIELILKEKKKGKTILMSSHMFEEVEKTCDRCVIIRDGIIVAIEDMKNLQATRRKVFDITFKSTEEAKQFVSAHPEGSLKENTVEIAAKKDTDTLIKDLAKYSIEDINARSQTLEELFMHFYGEETHV